MTYAWQNGHLLLYRHKQSETQGPLMPFDEGFHTHRDHFALARMTNNVVWGPAAMLYGALMLCWFKCNMVSDFVALCLVMLDLPFAIDDDKYQYYEKYADTNANTKYDQTCKTYTLTGQHSQT